MRERSALSRPVNVVVGRWNDGGMLGKCTIHNRYYLAQAHVKHLLRVDRVVIVYKAPSSDTFLKQLLHA